MSRTLQCFLCIGIMLSVLVILFIIGSAICAAENKPHYKSEHVWVNPSCKKNDSRKIFFSSEYLLNKEVLEKLQLENKYIRVSFSTFLGLLEMYDREDCFSFVARTIQEWKGDDLCDVTYCFYPKFRPDKYTEYDYVLFDTEDDYKAYIEWAYLDKLNEHETAKNANFNRDTINKVLEDVKKRKESVESESSKAKKPELTLDPDPEYWYHKYPIIRQHTSETKNCSITATWYDIPWDELNTDNEPKSFEDNVDEMLMDYKILEKSNKALADKVRNQLQWELCKIFMFESGLSDDKAFDYILKMDSLVPNLVLDASIYDAYRLYGIVNDRTKMDESVSAHPQFWKQFKTYYAEIYGEQKLAAYCPALATTFINDDGKWVSVKMPNPKDMHTIKAVSQ